MAIKTETVAIKVTPEEKEQIQALAANEEKTVSKYLHKLIFSGAREETNHCIKCGQIIKDYYDTEFTQEKLIFTYKCTCGFYGEQIYNVRYERTEEVK